jgi:hypothetical protein
MTWMRHGDQLSRQATHPHFEKPCAICILHCSDQFPSGREKKIPPGCPAKTPGGDIPQAPHGYRRAEKLCAASMTTAQGGHTHPAGARRTTGVCAQVSRWMRRSGATCGYESRWVVLISQQTGSRFNESERGRSRPSGHFSGNLAWRSRDRPADCNSQRFPGPTVGQSSIPAAPRCQHRGVQNERHHGSSSAHAICPS